MTASHAPGALLLAGLLLVACGVLLAVAAALDAAAKSRRQIETRLRALAVSADPAEKATPSMTEAADALQARLIPQRLRFLVDAAGGWPALRNPVLQAAVLGVAAWGLGVYFFLIGVVSSAVAGGALAAAFFFYRLLGAVRSRQLAFLDDLPTAIDLLVRSAQAGIPITEAIGMAGGDVPDPVGAEFTNIAQLIRLGVELKDALYEAAERINLLDFDCFVAALVVQRETGGQLSETMENLATTIRRRKETRSKARGMTAEGRLTAIVLAALPFFTAGLMAVISPDYLAPLATDPTGRLMVLVAVGMVATAFLTINQLTKVDL